MSNTHTNTEANAVKDVRSYWRQRDAVLNSDSTHNVLKDIIRKLDDCDPVDAVNNLEFALSLFEVKLAMEEERSRKLIDGVRAIMNRRINE
jgi:hypothetical protein